MGIETDERGGRLTRGSAENNALIVRPHGAIVVDTDVIVILGQPVVEEMVLVEHPRGKQPLPCCLGLVEIFRVAGDPVVERGREEGVQLVGDGVLVRLGANALHKAAAAIAVGPVLVHVFLVGLGRVETPAVA